MPLDAISIDWLHARVKENEDGCLIWQGYMTANGQPQAGASGGRGYVRRWLWSLVHTKPLTKDMWVAVSCKTPGCVHPDHIVARPRAVAMRGIVRGPAERHRIAAARRRQSVVTDEMVAEIRNSSEAPKEIAKRLGVGTGYVSQIRTGRIRKQYGGHFAGLGAR